MQKSYNLLLAAGGTLCRNVCFVKLFTGTDDFSNRNSYGALS